MDELNGVSARFQSHPDAAEVGQAGLLCRWLAGPIR